MSKLFAIHTDASNTELGPVISQDNTPIVSHGCKKICKPDHLTCITEYLLWQKNYDGMWQMCHAHHEEQDPERSFFMVEAFWRSIWPTQCLLAAGLG